MFLLLNPSVIVHTNLWRLFSNQCKVYDLKKRCINVKYSTHRIMLSNQTKKWFGIFFFLEITDYRKTPTFKQDRKDLFNRVKEPFYHCHCNQNIIVCVSPLFVGETHTVEKHRERVILILCVSPPLYVGRAADNGLFPPLTCHCWANIINYVCLFVCFDLFWFVSIFHGFWPKI